MTGPATSDRSGREDARAAGGPQQKLVRIRKSPPEPEGAGAGRGEVDFSSVLAATRGDRRELEVPEWEEPADTLEERARRALYEVRDPEYPVSVVDLGLIYGVEADEERGRVTVRLTFTATGCPCMDFIRWDVRERLLEEAGVEAVEVETVWDPPWTAERITDRGRRMLARAGVTV